MDELDEYVGIKVVHAKPKSKPNVDATSDDFGFVESGYEVVYEDGYTSWSPTKAFDDSYVRVDTGTGKMLKAVAAMAMVSAMRGDASNLVADEALNDNPSSAEQGIVSDAMIEGIARVCHELNSTWKQHCGQMPDPHWDIASDHFKESTMAGVREAIENPDATPASMHIAWLKYKTDNGWKFGPKKSEKLKTHTLMVPYSQITLQGQYKYKQFLAVVKALVH